MRTVKGEGDDLWWCEEDALMPVRPGYVRVFCTSRYRHLVFDAPSDWQRSWSPALLRETVLRYARLAEARRTA